MNIPLKTIDTEDVMAKEIKISKNKLLTPNYENGFNLCVTHNDTLTLDMDAEKMAKGLHGLFHDVEWVRVPNEIKEDYRMRAKRLLSNPTWLKLGVKK